MVKEKKNSVAKTELILWTVIYGEIYEMKTDP